jgi:hypothetical protein
MCRSALIVRIAGNLLACNEIHPGRAPAPAACWPSVPHTTPPETGPRSAATIAVLASPSVLPPLPCPVPPQSLTWLCHLQMQLLLPQACCPLSHVLYRHNHLLGCATCNCSSCLPKLAAPSPMSCTATFVFVGVPLAKTTSLMPLLPCPVPPRLILWLCHVQ